MADVNNDVHCIIIVVATHLAEHVGSHSSHDATSQSRHDVVETIIIKVFLISILEVRDVPRDVDAMSHPWLSHFDDNFEGLDEVVLDFREVIRNIIRNTRKCDGVRDNSRHVSITCEEATPPINYYFITQFRTVEYYPLYH